MNEPFGISELLGAVADVIENLANGDDAYYTPERIRETIAALRQQSPANRPKVETISGDDARWVTQTKFFDPSQPPDVCTGNCTEAALASILGIGLGDVQSLQGLRGGDYWFALEDFVTSRGFQLHKIEGARVFDGLYLADGPSPRGCGHFVVMRDGKMAHDPHPSRAGLLSVENTWLLIPHDPSTYARTVKTEPANRTAMPEGIVGTLVEMLRAYENVPCTWGRCHDKEEIAAAAETLAAYDPAKAVRLRPVTMADSDQLMNDYRIACDDSDCPSKYAAMEYALRALLPHGIPVVPD